MAVSGREIKNRRGPWNSQEDALLLRVANEKGIGRWVEIAQVMNSRSPKQCRERWYQNLKPDLNHGPITEDEGRFIEQQVARIGKKWAEIARMMKNRSDNAVKNWWNGGMNRRNREHRDVVRGQSRCDVVSPLLAPVHDNAGRIAKHYRTVSRPLIDHGHGHHQPSYPHTQYGHPAYPTPTPTRISFAAAYPPSPAPSLTQYANVQPVAQRYDPAIPSPVDMAPPSLISDHGSPAASPAYSPLHQHMGMTVPRPVSGNGVSGFSLLPAPRGRQTSIDDHLLHLRDDSAKQDLHSGRLGALANLAVHHSEASNSNFTLPPIRNILPPLRQASSGQPGGKVSISNLLS